MDGKIEYRYLDMDKEVLYTTRGEYLQSLKDRAGRATERCIANFAHGQVLYAGGVKVVNDFGDTFGDHDAVQLCRRLSGLNRFGNPR